MIRRPLFALFTLTLSLGLACAGPDDDDDDDDDDDEEDDTGPDVPPGTDSDGDGLTDEEEAELGTDPQSSDSDADGFTDAEELDAGYNPAFYWSHPFEAGDYLVGACDTLPDASRAGPTGTGTYSDGSTTYEWDAYQEGDTLEAWAGVDSFGQEVGFWTFCGNYMLVTVSAEWCGPCQELAADLERVQSNVRDDYPNFVTFELLYQNNRGTVPNEATLEDWKDTYGLDGIPVVGPESASDELISSNALEGDGYIPTSFIVAPDMTILSFDEYVTSAADIKAIIADHQD